MDDLVNTVVRELAQIGWKSHERRKPPLGWPRETDSLCPTCVIETRNDILQGKRDVSELVS